MKKSKYAATLLVALFPAAMVFFKVPGFNGPKYWRWHYSHDSILPYLLLTLPAAALLVWAHERWRRPETSGRSTIGLLVAAQVFLMFSYISLSKEGIRTIVSRVHDPVVTSYYVAALDISDLSQWISHYDKLLPGFPLHAQVHPPGPILYFFLWRRALGPQAAMQWGGIAIGLGACLSIPAIYIFTRRITGDARAGFLTAMLWTVLPGVIVMLPVFDQIYPLFTILLLHLWTRALAEGRLRYSIGFAAVLFVALLCSYGFLVLGAYFVLSAACAISFTDERRAAWRRVLAAGGLSFLLLLGLFAALYGLAGYNHLAALRQSAALQDRFLHLVRRPYPWNVPWDAYDFFLGSGWIPGAMLGLAATRWKSQWNSLPDGLRIFLPAALGCLLIVDVSALLPGEAARLWLFLQPLVVPLAGTELARWTRGWRLAACGLSLVILAVIRSRLVFFSSGN